MSKLIQFRARTVDTTKPMPVMRSEENPDLPDSGINRNVQQMPTGMEKEEECEHHLQRAISAQQAFGRAVDHVIPTPEVFPIDDDVYDQLYPPTFKMPRQLIHVQLTNLEQEQPEYDIDSEDEEWLNQMKPHLGIENMDRKLEEIMEILEKNSSNSKIIDMSEAEVLMKDVETGTRSLVYDHWLSKRYKVKKCLMPTVKTEKRDGTSGTNPYIAFRRRTEKMQTRKNRKNDESSYERMCKLKRENLREKILASYIVEREILKRDFFRADWEIHEIRYKSPDLWNNKTCEEIEQKCQQDYLNRPPRLLKGDENVTKKRRIKRQKTEVLSPRNINYMPGESSEEENSNEVSYQSYQTVNEPDDNDNPDGMFSFKRKKGCYYHAPLPRFSLPDWDSDEEETGLLTQKHRRYNFTTISCPPNYFVGPCRRRIGRGGRIIFDRRIANETSWMNDFDNSDDDDTKTKKIHYKPIAQQDLSINQEAIEYNMKHFEEDNPYCLANNPLKNYCEEISLRKQLYQLHQVKLYKFIEQNRQQQQLVTSMYKSQRSFDDMFERTEKNDHHIIAQSKRSANNNLSSSSEYFKSMNVDDCNSIINLIQNYDPTAPEMKLGGDAKESNFSTLKMDNINDNDMMVVGNDFDDFAQSNDHNDNKRITTKKLVDSFNTKLSNYSTADLKNGSECFDSNILRNEYQQSPATVNITTTSSSSSSESSSNVITNQNLTSTYSTCRKLKLNNNNNNNTNNNNNNSSQSGSNFQPTDVT